MSPQRIALALALVGVILLPGPAYAFALDGLDDSDRHRSSTGYRAEPVDASNDSLLVERYQRDVTFYAEGLTYRHRADEYRAPNETLDVLRTAVASGNATTTSDDVRADLRRVDRAEPFVTLEYDGVYDLRLSTAGETTTVRAVEATDAEIAAAVREELVVDYESLSAGERRTFEKIRNATTSDDAHDYRPWSDEPMFETPVVVDRDGEQYAVAVASETDDFDLPDGLFVGITASVVGIASLAGAAVVTLYARLRG